MAQGLILVQQENVAAQTATTVTHHTPTALGVAVQVPFCLYIYADMVEVYLHPVLSISRLLVFSSLTSHACSHFFLAVSF